MCACLERTLSSELEKIKLLWVSHLKWEVNIWWTVIFWSAALKCPCPWDVNGWVVQYRSFSKMMLCKLHSALLHICYVCSSKYFNLSHTIVFPLNLPLPSERGEWEYCNKVCLYEYLSCLATRKLQHLLTRHRVGHDTSVLRIWFWIVEFLK